MGKDGRDGVKEAANNLKNTFGKESIVLFRDLSFISRPVKCWRVVVHILNIDDYGGVVLIQIVGCDQSQFVLSIVVVTIARQQKREGTESVVEQTRT
jgi:hypothetical protein